MGSIKEIIVQLKEEFRLELSNLKKLKGQNLIEFMDIFSIEGEPVIYFNAYNIIIIDILIHDQLRPFLKESSLVLEINMAQSNTHLWIYQYFNERILNDYLK